MRNFLKIEATFLIILAACLLLKLENVQKSVVYGLLFFNKMKNEFYGFTPVWIQNGLPLTDK